jgi:thioredoxin reductase
LRKNPDFGDAYRARDRDMEDEYDIVIAGGGLAGLTARLMVASFCRKTFVLTGDVIGAELLSIERLKAFRGRARTLLA